MKKIFLFATLLGVALTSCVKDELSQEAKQQSKIVFDTPVVSPSTKVASEITTTYPQTLDFGVWADYYENGFNNNMGTQYINQSRVIYSGSGNTWVTVDGGGTETPYYWPKNGSLTFIAYSPYNVGNVTHTTQGIQIADYNNEDADTDLLFSERTYNVNNNGVTLNSEVGIQFKHALSSIRFGLRAGDYYPGTTIKIKSVKICNVMTKASFNQGINGYNAGTNPTPATDALPTNTCWSNYEITGTAYTTKDYTYTATSPFALTYDGAKNPLIHYTSTDGTTTPTANVTDYIFIPQVLNAITGTNTRAAVKVVVTYTIQSPSSPEIEQTSEAYLAGLEGFSDPEMNTSVGTINSWERGKRYTYIITVGLNKITFTPQVTGWDDVYIGGSL